MGRPTKLTKEIIEKAKGYIDTCHATPIETDKGSLSYVDVQLPKVASLAIYLGINKDTVYDWCKVDEEDDEELKNLRQLFSDIVKDINTKQEEMLIDKGLGGLFQPKTTGMLLSKHGYAEKQEVDHSTLGQSINEKSDINLDELVKEVESKLKEKKTK